MADCPICSKPLATGTSVVYKDDLLIHAGCWGDKPDAPANPTTEQPPAAKPPRRSAA
jgi:hypothetical protein